MKKEVFNKLVRDKIPAHIRKHGKEPNCYVAEVDEYWMALKEKLQEEVTEFLESEAIEEIADILEVVDALCIARGVELQEVYQIKKDKAEQRGAFAKRVMLIDVQSPHE